MNALSINNHELGIKEHNHLRVVTLKDVDIVHERPTGTARKRFNDNRKHFIDGEDYFVRKTDEARKEYNIAAPNGLILLTESGYLMLVKSFTDDLAWDVQRKLVKSYFRVKEEQPEPAAIPETTIIIKTYKGQPVLTVRDMTTITGIHRDSINHYLRKYDMFVKGVDYLHITGLELQRFKHVNEGVSNMTNGLNLVTLKGARKIAVYSPNYSPEMENQISLLYGQGQVEHVIETKSEISNRAAMFRECFDGDVKNLMGYIDFLQKQLRELEKEKEDITSFIGEPGPTRSQRIQLLMQAVEAQKCEIMNNPAYQLVSSGVAYGAITFSRCIGDITMEREEQLRAEVYEVFLKSIQANKSK